jgi:hypothetical protein
MSSDRQKEAAVRWLAMLAVVAYVLGAATGGTLYALLRKSVQASRASM